MKRENKYRIIFEYLSKVDECTARELSAQIKKLTTQEVSAILSYFHKKGLVEKIYNDRYGFSIWKPKNLNSFNIETILEEVGGKKVSDEVLIRYKGKLIPVSEYEKLKPSTTPTGIYKREKERWLPLLKFLAQADEPVPWREIVAGVGPRIANSIYSLRAKGYITLVRRRYALTAEGEQYLKELEEKLVKAEAKKAVKEEAKAQVEAKPLVEEKPKVAPAKVIPPKKAVEEKTEAEEIFE